MSNSIKFYLNFIAVQYNPITDLPQLHEILKVFEMKKNRESSFKGIPDGKLPLWDLLNINKKAKITTAYQRGYCPELIMIELIKRGMEAMGDLHISNFFERSSQGVYFDFCYSIVELFNNGNFNMSRTKPINFNELKKEKAKDWKQLSKEEKKLYRESKKESSKKQKEESIKLIEEYQKPGKMYFFIKLRNNIVGKN